MNNTQEAKTIVDLRRPALLRREPSLLVQDPGSGAGLAGRPQREAASDAPPEFSLRIQVFASSDAETLATCLEYLEAADYGDDVVFLDIRVAHPVPARGRRANPKQDVRRARSLLKLAERFMWPHGPKSTFYFSEPLGVQPRWLESWWPASMAEFVLLVKDTARLSPVYYRYLRRLLNAYYFDKNAYDPSIYGFSLQRWDEVAGKQDADVVEEGPQGFRPFLYQMMATRAQVLFPGPWKSFRLWYEEHWQNRDGNPALGNDMLWADEHASTCQDTWMSRFAEFLHSHFYFNVYAHLPDGGAFATTLADRGKVAESPSERLQLAEGLPEVSLVGVVQEQAWDDLPPLLQLRRYNYCFKSMRPGIMATNRRELGDMLQAIAINNTIIAISANGGMEDMLSNWLCYSSELHFTNYMIVSFDEQLANNLVAAGHAVFFLKSATRQEGLSYGTLEYQQLILERTKVIGIVLDFGYHVLLADIDSIWQSNPFLHLTDNNVDMYGQVEPNGDMCGGFLYMRNTKRMRALWHTVTRKFVDLVDNLAHKLASFKTAAEKARYLEANIEEHEQKLLNIEIRQMAKRGAFVPRNLSTLLFPSGKDFFLEQKPQAAGVNPVVIHNNWIIGKANKVNRFHEYKLWRITEVDFMCKCRHTC
eukprot:SM000185S04053  [mRNA]  locus=s185:88561:94615:- [translate_table: standard]